jgi:hypothetical protein
VRPASTAVYVSQLVDPKWLVEVEADSGEMSLTGPSLRPIEVTGECPLWVHVRPVNPWRSKALVAVTNPSFPAK